MILHLNPDLYMQLVGIERFRKFAKEAKTADLPVKADDGLQLHYSSKIFKAVSFNPNVAAGEWVGILDFFVLMKMLESFGLSNFMLVDASAYWLLNEHTEIVVHGRTSKEAALNLLGQILPLIAKDEESSWMARQKRQQYLYAIAATLSLRLQVLPVELIWMNQSFPWILEQAIRLFCQRDDTNCWWVMDPVKYDRYMSYSPWVTPMVATEQLLVRQLGWEIGLAPRQEAVWEERIAALAETIGMQPPQLLIYNRRYSTPHSGSPHFGDSLAVVETKLAELESNQLGYLQNMLASVVNGDEFPLALWQFMERVEQNRNTLLSVSRPG